MDFQKEVIDQSQNLPVLVDFWAPWCGPCQFLGPVLEELDAEQDRWKLVKVNVDEHPEISQEYGIRGIPDVRLFHRGKIIGQFTGAKPRHEIEKWIDEVFPDERISRLNQLIEKLPDSEDQLESFVKDHKDLELGAIALAKHIVWSNPGRAKELVKEISVANPLNDEVQAIRDLCVLQDQSFDGSARIDEILAAASTALSEGNYDLATEKIIEAVMFDKTYLDDLPRKSAIAIFKLLGTDHEITRKYRRRFDMALY